jgi:hypothetical protein
MRVTLNLKSQGSSPSLVWYSSAFFFFFFLRVCGTVYRRSSLYKWSDRRKYPYPRWCECGLLLLLLLVSTGIDKKKKNLPRLAAA